MKILHTSDWHLGHTLYTYDRTEEQRDMLLQLQEIVRQQQPDLFLLSGDVYHTSQPSAAVQTMFANALVAMHDACPTMTMVITAGNHDSGSKHDIFRLPWRALHVYTIGNIVEQKAEDQIIEVPGKGFVIAMPYVYERNLPQGYYQQLLDLTAERNKDGLPVVMMAHATLLGCDFAGHENASEKTVGGIESYELAAFGNGYDYLALGHIHHSQFVHGGEHRIRYSGSPLAVSFDECYTHSVSLVEIGGHGDDPVVQEVEIKPLRPLVTLPAQGYCTWAEARQLLAEFPDTIDVYIRLNVEVDDFLPVEAHAEAKQLTISKLCRFCLIHSHRVATEQRETQVLSMEEFKAESPLALAERYAHDKDVEFDKELRERFLTALRLVEEESGR